MFWGLAFRGLGVLGFRLFGNYLEGQKDLVSRFISPTSHIVASVIPAANLLTKSV